jgi:hypothetical protein
MNKIYHFKKKQITYLLLILVKKIHLQILVHQVILVHAAPALSLAFNSSTSRTVSFLNKGVATTNVTSAAAVSKTLTGISEIVSQKWK